MVTKEFLTLSLDQITPYKGNPRKIGKDAVDAVISSIRECEALDPIEVDENNVILSGHTRLKALKKLGYKAADVVRYKGLTPDQKRKYRVLANKAGEFSTWDYSKLETELEGLTFDFDFGFGEVEKLAVEQDIQHDINKAEERFADANILSLEKAQYPGVGRFDIPEIKPEHLPEITEWIGFNYMLSEKNPEGKGVHCFLNDYQFERLWNAPDRYIEKLSRFACIASPDFSPYGDMPFCLQLFNHYRKHWVGRYLQEHGVHVIPTIRASTDPRSKIFYLDGEPIGGDVIISSMYTTGEAARKIYQQEYDAMFDTLQPERVYIYGKQYGWERGVITSVKTFVEKHFRG